MVFHGMEIHEFSFLFISHSSFPWTGAGETGLRKSGRTFGHVLQSNEGFVESQYVGNIWNSGKPLIGLCFYVECCMMFGEFLVAEECPGSTCKRAFQIG